MPRPRAALLAVGLAVALSGCGGGSRYANTPPPPSPTLVAAAITATRVSLSPDHFGAGLVQLVVTNLTASSQQLTLRSTAGPSFAQQTAPINPADTAELKAELGAGRYTVSVTDAGVKAARLAVAARRPSSAGALPLP